MQVSPVSILFVSIISSRCLQDMSWRHLQDMSSRHIQDISSGRFEDMSWRRLQDMSWRRLQDVFRVTIFCLPSRLQDFLQEVFETSSRRLCKTSLEDVKLLHWRRVKTSSRLTSICWDYTQFQRQTKKLYGLIFPMCTVTFMKHVCPDITHYSHHNY